MDTEQLRSAHWNLGAAQLLEHAVRRHEGLFASGGSYVVRTGQFTGRSPKDKFIVRDDATESSVQWGPVNQPMSEAGFERLYARVLAYCQEHDLFVQDCFGGADPRYALAEPRFGAQFRPQFWARFELLFRRAFIRRSAGRRCGRPP